MGAFTVDASLDAKGRVVIPAAARDRLDLAQGDTVRVTVRAARVDRFPVAGRQEAVERIAALDDVRSFTYRDGVLEVVRDA